MDHPVSFGIERDIRCWIQKSKLYAICGQTGLSLYTWWQESSILRDIVIVKAFQKTSNRWWVQPKTKKFVRMRFGVFMEASKKLSIFLAVVLCSLVEVLRRFRGDCCLHHQTWRQHSTTTRKTDIFKFWESPASYRTWRLYYRTHKIPLLNQLNSVCSFTACFSNKQHSQTIELFNVSKIRAYIH